MKREFKVLPAVAMDVLEKTLNELTEEKWMLDKIDFFEQSGSRLCTIVASRDKKPESSGSIGIR
ncbi:MAG: hypothetical protein K2X77_02935 [Candidatus Obscuribacterales bacterium]|nr:hypothetical protein [Candidatus Obscuribacterales bacterium]